MSYKATFLTGDDKINVRVIYGAENDYEVIHMAKIKYRNSLLEVDAMRGDASIQNIWSMEQDKEN